MTKPTDTEVSTSIALAATDKGEDVPVKAKPEPKPEYKVAELRDGMAIVEMEDGRMFPAAVPEGSEVKKHSKVTIKAVGEDKDGVPTEATIGRVL